MSKKKEEPTEVAPQVEEQEAVQPQQIDPRSFSYRRDGKVEMSAEVFEILRGYAAEQAQKHPPKKMFLGQKPVPAKAKDEKGKAVNVVEWVDFETDEEYKNQKTVEFRDTESFNAVYVVNILHQTHMENIEKGNAVAIETLRKEAQEQESNRLKKVEE